MKTLQIEFAFFCDSRFAWGMIRYMRAAVLLILLSYIVVGQSSPADWKDRDEYLASEGGRAPDALPNQQIRTRKAMIAGVLNPFAVHAGLEILKGGGSAADAVLTAALAQIALNAGATVSYAGILTAVYYEAKSGKVYSLNASWDTPRNETDPLSIPVQGTASGRTALVPGFMAGVEALHQRFGRRPFAELFDPAIWLADHGFPFPPAIAGWRRSQAKSIERLDETRRIFQKEDGSDYDVGEVFRQPQLANTLRQVATHGAEYMYRGEWAHRFVDAVQREGGKVSLDDMASYRALWTEPTRAMYHGYEVTSAGLPGLGGLQILSSLQLAELANLSRHGDYRRSADALDALIQIAKLETVLSFVPEDRLRTLFPGLDPAPDARLSPATTKRLAAALRSRSWFTDAVKSQSMPAPNHSSSVVAVDEQGNVAALLHSCNCFEWGATGIFVEGISIPDSATFQQAAISRTGPGHRLPETTDPLIVLKDKRPVLASSAIGSALQEVTLQNLINILDLGMDPQTAVDLPNFQGPFVGISANGWSGMQLTKEVLDRGFPASVIKGLKKRGQDVYQGSGGWGQSGYWIGIRIDPKTGELSGGASQRLNSLVEGY